MNEWGRMMRVSEPWVSAPPPPTPHLLGARPAVLLRPHGRHDTQQLRACRPDSTTTGRQGPPSVFSNSTWRKQGAHKPLSRDGRPRPPFHPSRHGSGGVRTTSPLAATHHLGRVWEPALPACTDLHAPPQAAVPDVERPEAHGEQGGTADRKHLQAGREREKARDRSIRQQQRRRSLGSLLRHVGQDGFLASSPPAHQLSPWQRALRMMPCRGGAPPGTRSSTGGSAGQPALPVSEASAMAGLERPQRLQRRRQPCPTFLLLLLSLKRQ